MAEFSLKPRLRSALARVFLRPGLAGMLAVVAVVFAVSGPNAERLGDRFQVALPLLALGCALADGSAPRLVGRYLLLEVFIKVPKHTLGEASVNLRPNGGDQGFPSGHTAAAAFGATALVQGCLRNNAAAQAVAILSAGFTGASRLPSGYHNIWQVLAGAILGFVMQSLTLTAFDAAVARLWQRAARLLRGAAAAVGLAVAATVLLPAGQASAQYWTFDLFTGSQSGPHAVVSGTDPEGVGDFDFTAGWEGRMFDDLPYYGARAVRWRDDSFGWFGEFNHTKLYADDETLGETGFEVLEFSDGLNHFTFGPMWRWPEQWGNVSPFLGVGAGFILPHVEVQTTETSPLTFEYQYGGPAVSVSAGASVPLGGRFEAMLEYKFTYGQMDATLEGGGDLHTEVITNAINAGIRVRLGRM